jgi:hypothetical protein
MNHLGFKAALCKALLYGWPVYNSIVNEVLTHRPNIHMPSYISVKRTCVVCEVQTPQYILLLVWP